MKRVFTSLVIMLLTASVFAQSPEKMSYQAIVRNASNNLVTSTNVGMQISILQGSTSGTAIYEETHIPTTNANGLVTIEIGDGTTTDDISTIDWANGPYFIKTETDPTGGTNYTITGISQLLSVPYALHAKTAETIAGGITETDPVFGSSIASGITGTDTVNWNSKLDTEIDGDVTNEIQTIFRSGLTITLSNGGGTYQDSVNTYTAGTGIDITNNIVSVIGGSSEHYIGELYGGGIVYYVNQTGQHGLIASLDDLDSGSGVSWSNIDDTEIGLSAQDCYNGTGNTTAIIGQSGHISSAAKLCNDYSNVGFDDWYLPSTLELRQMYDAILIINDVLSNDGNGTTRPLQADAGLPYGKYWSSTEEFSEGAWYYSIGFGSFNSTSKSNLAKVRAVRAF